MAGGSQKEDEPITQINVTPLVDVCLVLVIIFMAVAPMAVTLGIKVLETRPSNAEGKASADENVNIKITADGAITVNGTRTDGVTFRGVLVSALASSKDKMVIITADATNKVGLVVEVLDASKQAGALKLAVMKAGGAPKMAGSNIESDDPITDINITPLVDVCLVLVIIFMVTAPMFSDPPIKVDLPSAHTHEGEEADKLTITLSKEGEYAIDAEKFTDPAKLGEALKAALAQKESKMVVLRADKDALHGQLTDLMARAKDAGAQSLTIATEQLK